MNKDGTKRRENPEKPEIQGKVLDKNVTKKSKRIVHKNFIKSDSSEILVEKCRIVILCYSRSAV